MDDNQQLKLQAYLDAELPATEVRQVEQWLAADSEAQALLAELTQTHQSLHRFDSEVKHPESREFFWSKVKRQIESAERKPVVPVSEPFWVAWRKLLVPAGAVAAVMVALLVTLNSSSSNSPSPTRVKDSATFTYRDYDSGTTLVWLSYPAENELAQSEPLGIVP